jgi:hypothetical protein
MSRFHLFSLLFSAMPPIYVLFSKIRRFLCLPETKVYYIFPLISLIFIDCAQNLLENEKIIVGISG